MCGVLLSLGTEGGIVLHEGCYRPHTVEDSVSTATTPDPLYPRGGGSGGVAHVNRPSLTVPRSVLIGMSNWQHLSLSLPLSHPVSTVRKSFDISLLLDCWNIVCVLIASCLRFRPPPLLPGTIKNPFRAPCSTKRWYALIDPFDTCWLFFFPLRPLTLIGRYCLYRDLIVFRPFWLWGCLLSLFHCCCCCCLVVSKVHFLTLVTADRLCTIHSGWLRERKGKKKKGNNPTECDVNAISLTIPSTTTIPAIPGRFCRKMFLRNRFFLLLCDLSLTGSWLSSVRLNSTYSMSIFLLFFSFAIFICVRSPNRCWNDNVAPESTAVWTSWRN